jgi:hypothetical protein
MLIFSDKINYQLFLYKYYRIYHYNYDLYEYEVFFDNQTKNYDFLQKIKAELKEHYYKRIENIYKNIYHPQNLIKILNDTNDIDLATNILDEEINITMQNIF